MQIGERFSWRSNFSNIQLVVLDYLLNIRTFPILTQGNAEFKQGEYVLAVQSYSKAMELDPLSAVMPANRAMAHLKLKRSEL